MGNVVGTVKMGNVVSNVAAVRNSSFGLVG